jgi:EmrB/QacA subfamily drug resistance transporter
MSEVPVAAKVDSKVVVVAALMLAISLAALDTTVVGTALPTIVGKLGGLSLFSWVFSVYLLTSTVTVPLYGKLADLYGRKPILLFGCAVFLIGSALCGTAGSMEQLILFRAVQGLGAGAVLPVTMTVIGDMFSIEERARIQGLTSTVWGITSLAGPALGGVITEGVSWRWIFYINLPLGLATIVLISRFYREQRQVKQSHVIDYWGTILLSGAVIALLLGLLQGVVHYGWLGSPTLGLFGVSALLLALFLLQESKAAEPVLPLWLFRNKVIAVASLIGFVTGGLMIGVNSYVPLYAQGVHGGTAIDAGLIVLPMSVAWPAGSVLGGRMMVRSGYYTAAMLGAVVLVIGTSCLLLLSRDASVAVALVSMAIIGMGMGLTMPSMVISVQNAVEWRHRGIATASTQFFRTIGGAIGVAIMGAILTSAMASRLAQIPGVPEGARADNLLTPGERAKLPAEVLDAMQRALAGSLHEIFYVVVLAAVAAFAIVLFFPRGRAQDMAKASPNEDATTTASTGRERRAFGASEGS